MRRRFDLTLNRIELNPRIARWALELLEYDFELVHKAGKHMQHVDALSRNTNILIVETNSFEERKWSAGESFGSYVDDKVMLAQGINIDAEELLSVVIEGIPNIGLRIQAQIQCFDDVKQLKRAFADFGLPKPYGAKKEATSLQSKDNNIMRCFNCNARGHWAKDCRKPKREKGSCYACGEMGHFVAQCLKNKTKGVGDNNYNAS
ncbi:uncharacterized protein LOC122320707 [Drosophila ficusphila]|uniref:uncharacterized protein LOC122320707 n=1 Tax=Drosophila ficusphila TaxID=30025 RepID=UPI001C8A7C95|nr:uncharacterized protein LOC122320707 [Drosophila ficusphila]